LCISNIIVFLSKNNIIIYKKNKKCSDRKYKKIKFFQESKNSKYVSTK
jgi:hypothetical protein